MKKRADGSIRISIGKKRKKNTKKNSLAENAEAIVGKRDKTQSADPAAATAYDELRKQEDELKREEREEADKARKERIAQQIKKQKVRDEDKKDDEKMSQAISEFERSMTSGSIEKQRKSNETFLDSKLISLNNDGMVPPWKRWNIDSVDLARNSFQSEFSEHKRTKFKNAMEARQTSLESIEQANAEYNEAAEKDQDN